MAAELLLEYVRKEEDRCLNLYAGKTPGRGQPLKVTEENGQIAAVRCKRDDEQNTQSRVQYYPEPAGFQRHLGLCFFGDGAVKTAHGAIEIPKNRIPGMLSRTRPSASSRKSRLT